MVGGETDQTQTVAEETDQTQTVAEETDQERWQALEAYLRQLAVAPVDGDEPRTELDCGEHCGTDGQEGHQYCTYRRYREGEWRNEFMVIQPGSAVLFPGNVLRGEEALNGVLTPLGLPLAPMGFSVSLENLGGSPTGHMDEPSLSACPNHSPLHPTLLHRRLGPSRHRCGLL
jgi:hypothetical protein